MQHLAQRDVTETVPSVPAPSGMMVGQVGQKAMEFGPSFRRLLGHLRPQRIAVTFVFLTAVISVGLSSIGQPREIFYKTSGTEPRLFIDRLIDDTGADLACIDSWTLAIVADEEPDLVSGLHRVGLGPLIPSPAVTI